MLVALLIETLYSDGQLPSFNYSKYVLRAVHTTTTAKAPKYFSSGESFWVFILKNLSHCLFYFLLERRTKGRRFSTTSNIHCIET